MFFDGLVVSPPMARKLKPKTKSVICQRNKYPNYPMAF